MPWGYVAAATIGSSLLGANAAQGAADTQAAASNNAAQLQKQMFDTQNQQQTGYRAAGQNALSNIGALGTGQYQTYDQAGNPVGDTQTGSGYLQHQFNAQDFANNVDPGYAFRLKQGQASQEYQNAFNRYQTQRGNIYNTLASIAGLGQTSLGQTGQMSTQTGANIGNAIQNAGSAQAAGQVGTANAIGGGLTGAANSYLLSNLLKPQTQGWNSAWGSPSNPVYTPGSDSFVGPMAVQ